MKKGQSFSALEIVKVILIIIVAYYIIRAVLSLN